MPVGACGPICKRCHQRPVLPADIETGLCVPCAREARAVGRVRLPASTASADTLTRFDAWVAMGLAHRAESREFEGELRAWLAKAAA